MVKHLFTAAALLLAACTAPTPNQPATPVVEGAVIELAMPAAAGGLTINEALWNRQSSRDFTAEPLTLEELSEVLWAAGGVNRPESGKLTAPSAKALYPIRIYAFLAGGAYRYDPAAQLLERVAEGDYRALTARQPFANEAALNIVYIGDLSKFPNASPEQARHTCAWDAAGYAENVNLYAAGHGLKAITRGSYQETEVLAVLGLPAEGYAIALAQTVGK